MKPLLLLDVDGVVSPLGRAVPRGFERRTTPEYDGGSDLDALKAFLRQQP